VKNSLEKNTIKTSLDVLMPTGKIKISSIELQIAYKEKVLKSDKDLEDAKHLETVFKDKINNKLLEKYRGMLE
jgi:dihydroorotase